MGRGRAKAKQQKVARDLKYNSHPTDLTALQRELRADQPHSSSYSDDLDESDEDSDSDGHDDDQDDWATASR
jgi:hypothetical protein